MKSRIGIAYTIILLAIITIVSKSTAAQEGKATGKSLIAAKKFERLMKKPNTVVIDVRTAEEYHAGHIPGAILLDVNQDDFAAQIKDLDQNKKYLLYCRSGKRSEKARSIMASEGFSRVRHLAGGIEEWLKKGKTVSMDDDR